MKVSEYIAALQAIMDTEGDIDVVKTDPAYGSGAQGFECRSADAPKIFRSGTLNGRQHVLSQGGRDIASSEPVVCVNAPMSFSWNGGGGAGGIQTFSIPSDANEVYISRRGGGLPPVECAVKIERKD